MAMSGINGSVSSVQPMAPQMKTSDIDKDNDGSKMGEVESAEKKQPAPPKPTATMGNNVNTYA